MSNPLWMRSALVAAALGLFSVSACGDSGNPDPIDERDPCDLAGSPDLDCDGDGMSNAFETANGFDPKIADEDNNGVYDGWDDTDDDGLPNWAEEAAKLDPRNPKTSVSDAAQSALLDGLKDADGDGSNNMAEAWAGEADTQKGLILPVWDLVSTAVGAKPSFACDPTQAVADPFFKDMAFRFTSLKVTRPQGVGTTLTGIMGPDINKGVLNILAPVDSFEYDHCVSYFQLFAGSGVQKLDGDGNETGVYVLEDLSELQDPEDDSELKVNEPARSVVVQMTENTAFFRTTVPLSMIFPGTLPTAPGAPPERFFLDLDHLTAGGLLTRQEDGSVKLIAFIDGSITYEAAAKTTIRLQPDSDEQTIDDLLRPGKSSYTPPGASEPIGYHLRAVFTASTVDYDAGE